MIFPDELKYSNEHEWICVDGDVAKIGITAYAQKELGDIVYVELVTQGETLEAGQRFGTIEAVKTVSDLYMPVSATINEVNALLESVPEKINQDPYGDGWMIRAKLSDNAELDKLMSAAEYMEFVNE